MAPEPDARAEAAAALRRFLDAVDRGELQADSAHAKALLRRIEGAISALEAATPDAKRGDG